MKKKFVRVMLFGALTLAVSTAVTSCKDYDDDIKNLQEQINTITSTNPVSTEDMKTAIASAISTLQTKLETAIAGKADNQAVKDLLETVTALQTALDNKADASTIQTLGDKITALSKEVNSIKGDLGTKQQELEAKVNDLAEQLANAASSADIERLAGELATAKTELDSVKKMAENNAAAIVEIQSSITELKALEGRIAALEEFNKNVATQNDLASYVESSELNGLIDTEVVKLLEDNGSIAAYVKGVVEGQISTAVDAINNTIGGVDSKLSTLSTAFDDYKATQSSAYTTVTNNIATLKSYTDAITAALTNGNYQDFAAVLTKISELETSYNSCVTTTNLGEKVDAYLKTVLSNANTEFGALSLKVKALENQIQSVAYIPEFEDGRVEFISFFYGDKLVAQAEPIQVRFRISPITAVAKFTENYTATFEGTEVKTRGVAEDYAIEKTEVDEKTGIVTFTLSTQTQTSYAISLNLTAKKTDENLTNINSNYFPVISDYRNITNVEVVSPSKSLSTIYCDNEKSTIDYATNATLKYTGTNRAGGSVEGTVENSSFVVTYGLKEEDNWEDYQIGNGEENVGVLSLKVYGSSATAGKMVTPKATVTMNYADGTKAATYETEFAKVTSEVSTVKTANVASTALASGAEFNAGKDQIFPIELTPANYTNLGITKEQYEALSESSFALVNDEKAVRFAFYTGEDATPNQLAIIVPKGIVAGSYPVEDLVINITEVQKIKLTAAAVTVQVTANYTFAYDTNIASTQGEVELLPTFTPSDKPEKVEFNFDLSSAFSNYDAVKEAATKAGASIKFSLVDPEVAGVVINGTNVTVNNKYEGAANTPIEIIAEVIAKNSDNADVKLSPVNTGELSITLTDISGEWKITDMPTELAIGSDKLDDSFNLVEKAEWVAYNGKTIWKGGSVVNKDWGVSPLTIFGFEAPVIELSSASDEKYATLKDGVLTLTPAGKLLKGVDIAVKVTVASHWGTISNGITTITVKVDNTKKSSEITFP